MYVYVLMLCSVMLSQIVINFYTMFERDFI